MAMQVKDANRARRSIGVAFVVTLVLHVAIFPNISLAEGKANLLLVFAAYIALSIGGEAGVTAGFMAGLAFDLTTTGPVGLMALELTLASFVLGRERRNRLAEDPHGSMRAFLVAAPCVEVAYGIAMLATGSDASFLSLMFMRALPSVVLDYVVFAVFLAIGSRGNRGGAAFSGGAGSSVLGGKRIRGR